MVALLQPARHLPPRSIPSPRNGRSLRLVVDNTAAPSTRSLNPSSVAVVFVVMVVMLLVVLIRGVQGAPPADTWSELSAEATVPTVVSASGSSTDSEGAPVMGNPVMGNPVMGSTVTVAASDTWASIAARVAPEADPVEFARRMAELNGGYQLFEGQVLVLTPVD